MTYFFTNRFSFLDVTVIGTAVQCSLWVAIGVLLVGGIASVIIKGKLGIDT